MHTLAIRTVKTRARAGSALWLPMLCAFALAATRPARADLSVAPYMPYAPVFIKDNVNGNLTISNPKHLAGCPIVIASTAKISGSVIVHDDSIVNSAGQISGSVIVHDNSIVTVAGPISGDYSAYDTSHTALYANLGGTLFTYNSSSVRARKCSLGGVRTYNNSQAEVWYDDDTASNPSIISVGSVECYNFSRATFYSGQLTPGSADKPPTSYLTVSSVLAHQNSIVQVLADVPHGAQADGQAQLSLTGTYSSITSRDRSSVNMDIVYCSGTVAQYQSGIISATPTCILTGNIIAYGWPGGGIPTGTPLHYTQGGIYLGVGFFLYSPSMSKCSANIYALGGFVNIQGGYIYSNMLYGQAPQPDPNGGYLHSVVVTGMGLKFGQFGGVTVLTGKLQQSGEIWAICSGTVELGDKVVP